MEYVSRIKAEAIHRFCGAEKKVQQQQQMMPASNAPTLPFSSIANAEQLDQVLQLLLTPNSASVKLGEEYLKVFCKQESCIPALIQQIQLTKSEGIKQLAAVLVRSRIPSFWPKLDTSLRQQLQNVLLQNVLQEKLFV